MHKFSCQFSLVSSHYLHDVCYRGRNNAKLKVPFQMESPFGLAQTSVSIDCSAAGYIVIVHSVELYSKDAQLRFLTELFEIISVLIAEKEHSPDHGTVAVESDWFEFKSEAVAESDPNGSRLGLRDSLETEVSRTIELSSRVISGAHWHNVVNFYFEGLKAELKSSKFFHWFLVLEFLEGSAKCTRMFSERLFEGEDKAALIKFASGLSSDTARGSVLQLQSRTSVGRNKKLVGLLGSLEIEKVIRNGSKTEIDEKMIRRITEGRNGLFHSGSSFNEAVLWWELFPIVTQVVRKLIADPECVS